VADRAAEAAAPFGLMETVRVVDGAVPFARLHQRRLEASWPSFFRGRPPSIAAVAAPAIAASKGQRLLVRVRFVGERDSVATADVESRPLEIEPPPVRVAIASSPRREPREARRHKSADRAWVLELAIAGAFETIVWDDEGGLLEGTRSNLFLQVGGELFTPPVELGLVPGVVRAEVARLAPGLGWAVRERPLAPADLKQAAAILLTGSGVGVVAVDELDGRAVGSRETAELAGRLARAVLPAG